MTRTIALPRTHRRPSFKQGYATHLSESAHPALWQGVVAAWPTSLGHTGTHVPDSSRKVHPATLTGSPNAWFRDGDRLALHLQAAGGDRYLTAAEHPQWNEFDQLTISCWFRLDDLTHTGSLLGRWRANESKRCFDFAYYNSGSEGLRFATSTTNTTWDIIATSVGSLNANEWYHAAAVYNGRYLDKFIRLNGTNYSELFTRSSPENGRLATNDLPIRIGRTDLQAGSPRQMIGDIADVYVWNRALTEHELNLLYDDPLAPFRLRTKYLAFPTAAPPSIGGTITALADTAGDFTVTAPSQPVSGTITALADTNGDFAFTRPVSGTVTALADTAGNFAVNAPGAISGTIRALADTAGDVTVTAPTGISGTITAEADTAGDFTFTRPVAGTITALGDTAGNIPIGVFTPNPCRICTPPKSNPTCISTEC